MKILYFHQHFSTPHGSTGTRSFEMAQRLIKKGHQVTMVCGSYKLGNTGLKAEFHNGVRRGNVYGIDVIELYLPYSNNDSFIKRAVIFLKFAIRSIKLAFSERYDILFATSTPLTAGIPGIVMKLFRSKPFIFEVRDLWPELPKEMGVIQNPVVLKMLRFLEWTSYKAADKCIGLSPGIKKGIITGGAKNKSVAMIPNGCDLEMFKPGAKKSKKKIGLSDADFVAIFMGAHGIANGLDAALDAAKILKTRQLDYIKLIFVGDGKLKNNLIKRAVNEKLDNCIFLEPVPKTELNELLYSADIGLMLLANVTAFYYGTSPNKFFDYIAAGLPVLNNYPGWLSDLIKEYHCGIAVPPDSPEYFAEVLSNLANDPGLCERMGRNARKLAEQSFNRELLGDQFVKFITES